MKHIKKYKLFESRSPVELERDKEYIEDILSELHYDHHLIVSTSRIRKDVEVDPNRYLGKTKTENWLEAYISRPWNSPNREIPGVVNPEGGYPGNLIFWYELKDTIISLTKWYYELLNIYDPIDKSVIDLFRTEEKEKLPLRFFGQGMEMFIGFSKEEDFEKVGDFISFTNFRIMIKL